MRSFIETSLLRFEAQTQRYSFHPLLKRYLHDLFINQETASGFLTQHAFYYLSKLDRLFDEDNGEDELKNLIPDTVEIASAWRFACDQGMSHKLFHSAKALQRFASLSMRYDLGDDLLTYGLSKTSEDNLNIKTVLQINLALFKWYKHDYEKAKELASQGLTQLDKSSISEDRQVSLKRLGLGVLQVCYGGTGELEQAFNVSKKIFDLVAKTQPDSPAYVNAIIDLVMSENDALGIANFARLEEAERLAREKNRYKLPDLLCLRGKLFIDNNTLNDAELSLEKAENEAKLLNLPRWILRAQMYKAELAIKKQEFEQAKSLCIALLAQSDEQTHLAITYETLQRLAIAEAKLENLECATHYFDEALSKVRKGDNISAYLSIQVSRFLSLFKEETEEAQKLRKELETNLHKIDFPDRLLFQQALESPSHQ